MKDYQVIQEALDKATQRGAFNLQETGIIMQALRSVYGTLESYPKLQEELEGFKKREEATKNLKPAPLDYNDDSVGQKSSK